MIFCVPMSKRQTLLHRIATAPAFTAWLVCVIVLLGAQPATAHTGGTTGLATIVVSGQTVQYNLQLPEPAITPQLAEAMHLGQPGVAADYAPLLQAVATGSHPFRRPSVRGRTRNDHTTGSAWRKQQDRSQLCLRARAERARRSRRSVRRARCRLSHHRQYRLVGRQPAVRIRARRARAAIALSTGEASRGIGSFFLLGIEHILTGYDHLLFLLALILRGGNLWSLFKIITAFTIAHSITLALAALNIVMLPERFVEATIALSIAYVAAENLFMRKAVSHRWAVSFLFGLVHGFGFSNVLRELGLPKEGLLWSLLNFNLGVEAGQAMAVLVVVPILIWLRRFKWEPRAVVAMSIVVLAVGLTLFVERALFTG